MLSWRVVLVDPPPPSDIETVGLLVDLDAAHPSAGSPLWLNAGRFADFAEVGDAIATTLGPTGAPAVSFNLGAAGSAYRSFADAPEDMLGPRTSRSIEVWAFNPEIAPEETLVAWGVRGGPDGTLVSFNQGTDRDSGAVDHGGIHEVGWPSGSGALAPGAWHSPRDHVRWLGNGHRASLRRRPPCGLEGRRDGRRRRPGGHTDHARGAGRRRLRGAGLRGQSRRPGPGSRPNPRGRSVAGPGPPQLRGRACAPRRSPCRGASSHPRRAGERGHAER